MVDGIHRYLDKLTVDHVPKRTATWKPDYSSPQAYARSLEPQRQRLRKILGVVDQRLPPAMEYVSAPNRPALLGRRRTTRFSRSAGRCCQAYTVKGCCFEPSDKARACVVAIPDADQTRRPSQD